MSSTRVGGPVLSPEQAAAAHAGPQGAYLIAAGPGTGKTFTATERFCWLVEQGVAPDQILTVTFSDRAAEELRRRITDELSARRPDFGPQALDGAWIGTFHSVCARLLDEFAYLVGSPRELRVLDETGQRLFEQELVARLRSGATAPFDPDSFAALSVDDLDDLLRSGLRFLLKLKGRGINPERFHERALALHAQNWAGRPAPNGSGGPDPAHAELEAIEVLFIVYSAYEDALHAQGLRDFDDLLLEVIDARERVPSRSMDGGTRRSTTSARVFPAGACPSLTTGAPTRASSTARRTSSAATLTLRENQSWSPPAAHFLPIHGEVPPEAAEGLPSVWLWRRTRAPRPALWRKPSAGCMSAAARFGKSRSFHTRSACSPASSKTSCAGRASPT